MLNLRRKAKIVLACSVLLSLLLLSSWSLLDITTYNLNFDPLKSPKTSSRSEIYTPYKDITTNWDYPASPIEHYPRINESGNPDGIRIGNYGEKETKEEIFELKCSPDKEEAGILDSVTVKTYCTCWAGYGGVSVLKVSYQMCLNGEWSNWSNNKIVSSTFSWRWKTFTWGNLGIELCELTTIKLRVKLISYINSRRYGGDVYVDTLKAELEFYDILDWGVDAIDAEEVWGGSEGATDVIPELYSGEGINILIIDSGIELDHPDLIGNYKGGYDFVDDDPIPEDNYGHGTYCAGIICAMDNDLGIIGVAPNVNIYMCRNDVYGYPQDSYAIMAIQWAIDNNMDIISISWSGSIDNPNLEQKLNESYNAGILCICCSGNYEVLAPDPNVPLDPEDAAVQYPAAYNSVIAVGAVNQNLSRWHEVVQMINPDTLKTCRGLAGSCYGPELDIVAPGVNIKSTDLMEYGGYITGTGTSASCPMVAGVCALILSASDTIFNLNGSARVRTVWHCLFNSTVQVGSVQYNQNGWHEEYGYGMVNASAAVNYAIDY
ncbi:MAG: S8 family serine peptidase [Promethearchaeota archaeon]